MTSKRKLPAWLPPLVLFGLGIAIWFTFPSVTGKIKPYDDDDYWTCMLATAALGGLFSCRRGWLAGLALGAAPLVLFCVDLISWSSRHWWPGLGVFVAFVALCAVVAEAALTLRDLTLRRWRCAQPASAEEGAEDPSP